MKTGKNEIALSIDEIVRALNGTLMSSGEGTEFTGVYTDSREVMPGGIFFALEGENTDGHKFVCGAAARGASLCIIHKSAPDIEKEIDKGSCTIIMVDDTLKALQQLAAYYRNKFPQLITVGITGSSGKTTTKELTGKILSGLGATVMTRGNLNSEIGLPVSMFSIRDHHRYGVFEMGINHEGEMDVLVNILHPQLAVVTNIGTAHIGILGSQDNIAAEKGKIFSRNPDLQMGFVFENDGYRDYLKELAGGKMTFYGADSMVTDLRLDGISGSSFRLGDTDIRLPLVGRYNVNNAMAAISVGQYLKADEKQIKAALESAGTMFGRGEIYDLNGIRVLCDCYNANFEAVKAVISFAGEVCGNDRLVLALGSLLELGDSSDMIHRNIGSLVKESGAAGVFLFGKEMRAAYDVLKDNASGKVFWSDDYKKLECSFLEFVRPGDFAVIKGSRGMAMERLVEGLKNA